MSSFYIINNEGESSESALVQNFPDTPKIKDFSKTKLNDNDKSSDLAKKKKKKKNYIFYNQVYDLTTEIEPIKMFIKEQFMLLKKALATFQTNRNNKTIKKL